MLSESCNIPSTQYSSHLSRSYQASLEAKTFGRIIDFMAIKKEISHIEMILKESEKSVGFLWKTAPYLHKRVSASRERMDWLKRQEKEQEELRVAYKVFTSGRIIPEEIISMVFSHVPTKNELAWDTWSWASMRVEGLLTHAVLNPSLLLHHYRKEFNAEWTLEDIGKQMVDPGVLLDTSSLKLSGKAKLRAITELGTCSLVRYCSSHQWKNLYISVDVFAVDDFFKELGSCLLRLEELTICALHHSAKPLGDITPPQRIPLTKANITFNIFSIVFNSGILNNITGLSLNAFNVLRFCSFDVFWKAIKDLPRMLSQLPRLYELIIWNIDCTHIDPATLPRVY